MAKGIQDLGIGLGYLYKVKPDGVTIVSVEKNTADGVRSIKIAGTNNGPVVAARPAYATITVNSVASAGAITAITIATVNQIGSNINITTSTASVAAGQIADAINAFVPGSGDDYTAQAIGDVVYVFSSPDNGSAANGATISVSATDPSIVTTTTVFTNGSSQNGIYDNTFGYRFYIDADYGSAGYPGGGVATPSSLTYALEITEYMTVRGLQSGIMTVSATIATDAVSGLTRACAITQILLLNQGGAATDVLAFLQTEGFAIGDEVRIAAASPGTQITTIESAPTTTSPIATKNIYLTDDASFTTDEYRSLTLQLRNISGVGLAWVETGRSISDGVITITLADFITTAGSRSLRPKGMYFISDLGDFGTFVTAIDSEKYDTNGMMIRAVPKGYASCWMPSMAAPAVGSRRRYYQNVYTSVTGAIGTAPDTDTVNWTVVVKTNASFYEKQVHAVGLNVLSLLGSWPIVWERDGDNNFISQSYPYYAATTVNAFNAFAWRASNTGSYGNVVIDGIFDCANSDGDVYQNVVTDGGSYDSNTMISGTIVAYNTITGVSSRVYGNYVTNMAYNTVKNGGLIFNNGAAGALFYQIGANTVEGSITNLTSLSAGAKSVEYCVVERGAAIKNSTFAGAAMIRYTTVRSGSVINNCVFSAPTSTSNIEACELMPYSSLTVNDGGARLTGVVLSASMVNLTLAGNPMSNVLFSGSVATITLDAASANSEVKSSTMTFTGSLYNAFVTGISTTGAPTIAITGVISPEGSSMLGTLDLDDAGVFSAGLLTIDPNLQLCGRFILTSTAVRNISEVSGLPTPYEVLFVTSSTNNITFTGTAAATVAGNQIAATAASFIIKAFASGASSMLWMANPYGFNTITRTAVLI